MGTGRERVAATHLMWNAITRRTVAGALAPARLAGPWTEAQLVARGGRVFARRPRWMAALVREVLDAYHRPPSDRPRELARYVALLLEIDVEDGDDQRAAAVRRWFTFDQRMAPARWAVSDIAPPGDLAAWLELRPGSSPGSPTCAASALRGDRVEPRRALRRTAEVDGPRSASIPHRRD